MRRRVRRRSCGSGRSDRPACDDSGRSSGTPALPRRFGWRNQEDPDPMKSSCPCLAVAALAVGLVLATTVESQIQVRREGAPPRPFDRSEMTSASTEVPMLSAENVLVEVRIDGKG